MKFTFIILILLINFSAKSQNIFNSTIIEIANQTDTLSIKQFDSENRLVFEKTFPDSISGISMLLGYLYENDKLTRFFWVHSNAGLIVCEYEYDSISDVNITFEYKTECKFENVTNFILSLNNLQELLESKRLKELNYKERKLNELAYFQDTLILKHFIFYSDGDTLTQIYKYKNNILSQIESSSTQGYNASTFYNYDSLGRIVCCWKGKEENPYLLFKYTYENPEIVIVEEIKNGEIINTEISEYKNSLLVKEIFIEGNRFSRKTREIEYIYDKNNILISKIDNNYYNSGKEYKIEYKYN